MITYNETIKKIKSAFSKFGIEFDNFCEEVKLSSLSFVGKALASELEIALKEEFSINRIDSVYDEESTIGEIANEIMEQCNSKYCNQDCLETSEDINIMWLVALATFSMIFLAIVFFL